MPNETILKPASADAAKAERSGPLPTVPVGGDDDPEFQTEHEAMMQFYKELRPQLGLEAKP